MTMTKQTTKKKRYTSLNTMWSLWNKYQMKAADRRYASQSSSSERKEQKG